MKKLITIATAIALMGIGATGKANREHGNELDFSQARGAISLDAVTDKLQWESIDFSALDATPSASSSQKGAKGSSGINSGLYGVSTEKKEGTKSASGVRLLGTPDMKLKLNQDKETKVGKAAPATNESPELPNKEPKAKNVSRFANGNNGSDEIQYTDVRNIDNGVEADLIPGKNGELILNINGQQTEVTMVDRATTLALAQRANSASTTDDTTLEESLGGEGVQNIIAVNYGKRLSSVDKRIVDFKDENPEGKRDYYFFTSRSAQAGKDEVIDQLLLRQLDDGSYTVVGGGGGGGPGGGDEPL